MPKRSRTDTLRKSQISRVMALIGSKGGKVGGKKRAQNMTQQERSKSASEAAKARWSKHKKAQE